ncbi:uncharacterized protein LOC127855568 [Dreissena polymorpha]|uniref:uncharacterized protein LOC127855568 n=1 Tax=Dreissena polymorpha TaxID=45954 RepID=UPI002264DF24|nr:uncharacterized protein LOC127855568 [Dreissena polymorpha]
MAYTAVCKAHSRSASSICFTHGTFLCIKCLLEKVEEKEDCIKYDMTDITDEKYQTKLTFLTMQQRALKQQETFTYRIKEVNKEQENLVKQVEEAKETLIKDIKDKAYNILKAINNEGNTIESKYQVFVKEIDEQLKPLEADIKRMESADSDIAKIRRSIEILEKELTEKYVVFGTVTADFETDKKLTETLKGLDSLGIFVLAEMEDYEPIGGEDNKAFANDEIEKTNVRETKKSEGIDIKDEGETIYIRKTENTEITFNRDIPCASANDESDIYLKPITRDIVEAESNKSEFENKEEEKPRLPVPRRSQLQSDDKIADKSKCCCN